MKEEDFIRKKYGSGNPFKVPEGYFEQFTSELMSKLPEKEMKPVLSMPSRRRTRMRTVWYAVAAALCGAMFLGTYYLQSVIHPHGERRTRLRHGQQPRNRPILDRCVLIHRHKTR